MAPPLRALALSACEGEADDSPGNGGVGAYPTSGGKPQGGNNEPAPGAGSLEATERYARCLRENGLPQAEVDEQRGGLRLYRGAPPQEAAEKCRQENPAGRNGGRDGGNQHHSRARCG